MKSHIIIASALIMALLASGCTDTPVEGNTLYVKMDAPSSVFSDEEFSAYIDIDNQGNRTYTNALAEFFNTGSFEKISSCIISSRTIVPNSIEILECKMKYGRFLERDASEQIDGRVAYDSNYNFGIIFPVMSEQKYMERKITGNLETLPKTFLLSNDEISAEIELSENPVVSRTGTDSFVYFRIKNAGSGFIENILGSGITITSVPGGIVYDCDTPALMLHDNGIFPKITCRLNTALGEQYENANIFLNIDYRYELRKSATITVRK